MLNYNLIIYRGIFTRNTIICLESKRLLALVVNTNALTSEDAFMLMLSHAVLEIPLTVACQAPLSVGFSR